jgi:uncharacterized protein (DUF1778 family)
VPENKQQVVCSRFGMSDLETVRVAADIMGQSVSTFTRTAAVTLAKAIIEAATDLGATRPGSGSWDRAGIAEGRIEFKGD